ncbi:phosphoglucomutase [Novimethylophilus kurashikiensis]|uniref:Phosphoglucomutase n=1 Tax=Novimethylophilus kurashikiensis TaxID=1825523 RepID=A0A2R5F7R6_9PROT|nr:hypothetical protein [Novimethylophilus kurashikiensis]GBG14282.1 phosphoglucomutase [Novimethylophilus kurashikiensis]
MPNSFPPVELHLPDNHMAVLLAEAEAHELSPNAALAQAVRLYQLISERARNGLQLTFVDAHGNIVNDLSPAKPVKH